jgi:hypothetical protein
LDTNLGHEVGYVPDEDYLATSDGVTSAGLAQFLSRPVRIANFTWNESDVPTIKTSLIHGFRSSMIQLLRVR